MSSFCHRKDVENFLVQCLSANATLMPIVPLHLHKNVEFFVVVSLLHWYDLDGNSLTLCHSLIPFSILCQETFCLALICHHYVIRKQSVSSEFVPRWLLPGLWHSTTSCTSALLAWGLLYWEMRARWAELKRRLVTLCLHFFWNLSVSEDEHHSTREEHNFFFRPSVVDKQKVLPGVHLSHRISLMECQLNRPV